MALEVPLALNLQRRAEGELSGQSLVQVQTIAQTVVSLTGGVIAPSAELQSYVASLPERAGTGRVIVVNVDGILIADSADAGLQGTNYVTNSRPELQNALIEGVPATRIARSESLDTEILAAAAPIYVSGSALPVGAVRITQPTTELRASIRRTLLGVAAIGIGGLVAGLLIAVVLAGSLSRPLQRLSRAAQRLGAGDLAVRADTRYGAKEIRETAAAFDEMAGRLERLVRAQREFVGNASHQLRTPLTGLKLRLESATAKAPESLRRDLEAAEHEADRLAAIVDRLLSLARHVEGAATPEVELDLAVEQAAVRWGERAEAAGASVRPQATPAIAKADAQDVGQILDNLIDNAIRYAPSEILVAASADGDRVTIMVEDRGPGIDPDDIERVTERFYRGRGATPGGSGLGLAVVRELAERWGGTVTVSRTEGGGTSVVVSLPSATGV